MCEEYTEERGLCYSTRKESLSEQNVKPGRSTLLQPLRGLLLDLEEEEPKEPLLGRIKPPGSNSRRRRISKRTPFSTSHPQAAASAASNGAIKAGLR